MIRLSVLCLAALAVPVLALAQDTAVAEGSYECWMFDEAQLTLNFTVTGAGEYIASDGTTGSFVYDPATTAISFTGYLGDAMPEGFTSIYEVRNGTPTVSFVSGRGAEAAFCERA